MERYMYILAANYSHLYSMTEITYIWNGICIFWQILHTEAMGLSVYLTPREHFNSSQFLTLFGRGGGGKMAP